MKLIILLLITLLVFAGAIIKSDIEFKNKIEMELRVIYERNRI